VDEKEFVSLLINSLLSSDKSDEQHFNVILYMRWKLI